jgi:hypothetical protein
LTNSFRGRKSTICIWSGRTTSRQTARSVMTPMP